MGILEELWYGNISPCERDFKKGSTYSELLGYIVRYEEELQKRMNDEEKEIFEKFTECQSEMYGIAEREAFVRGFHARSQDHHRSNEYGNRIRESERNYIYEKVNHHHLRTNYDAL